MRFTVAMGPVRVSRGLNELDFGVISGDLLRVIVVFRWGIRVCLAS